MSRAWLSPLIFSIHTWFPVHSCKKFQFSLWMLFLGNMTSCSCAHLHPVGPDHCRQPCHGGHAHVQYKSVCHSSLWFESSHHSLAKGRWRRSTAQHHQRELWISLWLNLTCKIVKKCACLQQQHIYLGHWRKRQGRKIPPENTWQLLSMVGEQTT